MSSNQYNENIDPKKEAAEAAAAADALSALGGSSINTTSSKKTRKKRNTEPTLEIVEENKKGNKYTSEKEKIAKSETASASVTAAKETGTKKTAAASTNKKVRPSTARTFVQIMNGEILTKDAVLNNLPFTFFIGFLFIVMIAWGYYAETVTKKEIQLEKDLGELNSEYFTLTADYNMQRGRRQIANRLENTGVKESQTSPKKIRVRKYVFN